MLKYERKKIKKYVFCSEIIQIINKIVALKENSKFLKNIKKVNKYQEMFPSVCDSTFNNISNIRQFWKRA